MNLALSFPEPTEEEYIGLIPIYSECIHHGRLPNESIHQPCQVCKDETDKEDWDEARKLVDDMFKRMPLPDNNEPERLLLCGRGY